jgi:hypothetical protein
MKPFMPFRGKRRYAITISRPGVSDKVIVAPLNLNLEEPLPINHHP